MKVGHLGKKHFKILYKLKLNVYQINLKRLKKTVEVKYFLRLQSSYKIRSYTKLFEEAV